MLSSSCEVYANDKYPAVIRRPSRANTPLRNLLDVVSTLPVIYVVRFGTANSRPIVTWSYGKRLKLCKGERFLYLVRKCICTATYPPKRLIDTNKRLLVSHNNLNIFKRAFKQETLEQELVLAERVLYEAHEDFKVNTIGCFLVHAGVVEKLITGPAAPLVLCS